ncbi:hypothetical protein OPT61_g5078 [Boeremia exigua]|uniref:Uncharacterized protein n=1 Tax=Boeremia exigua TaxID=749465 RepID=A0ACC2IBM2_9PLEO|nr:hypothetical protein OPT61_g5078 [Boeremia exigua]
MSQQNTPRRRTAEEAFGEDYPLLQAAPRFEHNPHHDIGVTHFTESPSIEIIVNGGTSFYIPAPFLSASHGFTAAIASQTRGTPITHFGTDPVHFRTYAAFQCQKVMVLPFVDEDDEAGLNTFWSHWAACYRLGKMIEDARFRNALLDLAVDKMIASNALPECLFKTIYKNSTESSRHRMVACFLALATWTRDEIEYRVEGWGADAEWDVDFGRDLLRGMISALRKGGLKRMSVGRCLGRIDFEYHDEEDM